MKESTAQHIQYKFGIFYVTPGFNFWLTGDTATYMDHIKKKHPMQYFFREYIPIMFYGFKRDLRGFIRNAFSPPHPHIRKALPRFTWVDTTSLIVDLNLAMIIDFKHEADKSYVDWTHGEHASFKFWLDSSFDYITNHRPKLQKQLEDAYPPFGQKGTYEELYGEVNRLEKLIEDTDKAIIKQMIDYSEYFWT